MRTICPYWVILFLLYLSVFSFFVGVIVGIFIFAENLEALKTYHICDGESKVKLTLKLGCLGYTINIPVTEQNCPACQEKRVEKDNIGKS